LRPAFPVEYQAVCPEESLMEYRAACPEEPLMEYRGEYPKAYPGVCQVEFLAGFPQVCRVESQDTTPPSSLDRTATRLQTKPQASRELSGCR